MTSPLATTRAPGNRVSTQLDAHLARLTEDFVARRGLHHANVALASGDSGLHWSCAVAPVQEALRPDTPFFVASITKRFIATLVLQAHERGELDLAAPIGGYLPATAIDGLHVLGGVDRTSAITVHHLASHTSGLPDHLERRRGEPSPLRRTAHGHDLAWTFEDVLRTTRERQRPHFAPQDLTATRQKARYSDTGFQLLIRVLESATGRTFAGLLSERILDPLGLTRTWLPGHRPSDPAAPPPSPPCTPGGAGWSCPP
ncbi:serine hydrolase domain-containing protein [Nocardiopsis aegyptia]|uniref:CubicO group peptidase (Beta-lactamase class C family) n=1 Tax=Nocardiopsis aegyptia TaxID=220378 RepID=A0A7Z0JDD0_9ACTN|nr:serine hydrolase domain-containing protein [Nocardiopsis aegyptia]NYJ38191.1 CubicO group peptidase (beta-lactamase class C family) [Nocardiopsis aegyptia]